MKILYSPDARDRLRQIKVNAGERVTDHILKGVAGLMDNPEICPKVEYMLGISTPYYFLHIEHNYVFYRIEDDIVYVTNIYNEKENFMQKLFGVELRSRESLEYWGE